MDDDRQSNILLAIALSLLVMVGWGWLEQKYFRQPPEPGTESPAPTQVVSEPAAHPGAGAPPARPPVAAAPGPVTAPPLPAPTPVPPAASPIASAAPAPVVETVVETPLLRIRFSSRGAVPETVELVQFASKSGVEGPVQLLTEPASLDAAPALGPSRALDLALPGDVRLHDAVFQLTQLKPGDPEHAGMLTGLDAALAEPARGTNPARLRDTVEDVLTRRGLRPAVAWSAAAAVTDVALSTEGALEAGWSRQAGANREQLAEATILDYSLSLAGGGTLHKVFILRRDRYAFDLAVVLLNAAGATVQFGEAGGYALVWGPGLASSERSPAQDPLEGAWLYKGSLKRGKPGVGLLARVGGWLGGGSKPVPQAVVPPPGTEWFALRRKYFVAGVRPMLSETAGQFVPLGEPRAGHVEMQVHAPALRAAPGTVAGHHYVVCVSPIHRAELEAVGHGFDMAVSFGVFDLFGKAMLSGLLVFNSFVRNYGLAIVLLTVLVRLGLFPLNQRSYQSMRAMSVMQPKITELRERYKNDPQEMNKRIWEVYRENNINPLGGCLPIVVQMPIFIALFNALRAAIELRGAEFLWIEDLSEPDRLATLPGGFALNVLPLLMIGAMLVQQRMSTPPPSGSNDPNAEMQRKMMQWMPLMFGVMFYGMPSGLTLYWLVSTLLGIGQQYYINKA